MAWYETYLIKSAAHFDRALLMRLIGSGLIGGGLGAVTGAASSSKNERLEGALRGMLAGGALGVAGGAAGSLVDAPRIQRAYARGLDVTRPGWNPARAMQDFNTQPVFMPLGEMAGGFTGGVLAGKRVPKRGVPAAFDASGADAVSVEAPDVERPAR